MKKRCSWAEEGNLLMKKYHDTEWGVPVYNDNKIFEFLVLESAQAGLSWQTILNKRKGYKKAFANFNPKKIAQFKKGDAEKLLKNKEIIRNKLKIEATINNAKLFLEIQKEFGSFSNYAWQFVRSKPITNNIKSIKDYKPKTKESELFSADLKRRGFKFLGPTVVYAHMQATGMVNDHMANCFRREEIIKLIKK